MPTAGFSCLLYLGCPVVCNIWRRLYFNLCMLYSAILFSVTFCNNGKIKRTCIMTRKTKQGSFKRILFTYSGASILNKPKIDTTVIKGKKGI